MKTKKLIEQEFLNTFSQPMRQLSQDESPPCDFWNYVEEIPSIDYEGYDCSAGEVDIVYIGATGRFQHVLINSEDKDVFMVIVLDTVNKVVFGHRLLNLKELYDFNK